MTTEQIRLAEKDREIEILRLKLAIAGGQNGLRPFLFRSRSASVEIRHPRNEKPRSRSSFALQGASAGRYWFACPDCFPLLGS